ncbi:MAG: redox-sensing transcriptional repressor Rex [Endomicrobium sp.]|jgi:redox-sensing transcriptional repressor|nr:redox-sensing transcriptional repressor Rex [Endomicrobium sp.]
MKLSDKVINRLTLYHNILVGYIEKKISYISSPQIAALLNVDASQVRKDLKLLNNDGICKVGYPVEELKKSIEKFLGFIKKKDAFIVGAGNLGMALAKYDNFELYGFNIIALFDNDPLKVGLSTNNKQVFHISKLENLAQRLRVQIAILTVPRQFAQQVADFLVKSGIKYIWNFSPCVIEVSEGVHVWNENLIGNFLHFTIDHGD